MLGSLLSLLKSPKPHAVHLQATQGSQLEMFNNVYRALHVPFGHIWQLAMAPNWKLANQMATLPEWIAMIPKMGYSTSIGSAWSAHGF